MLVAFNKNNKANEIEFMWLRISIYKISAGIKRRYGDMQR